MPNNHQGHRAANARRLDTIRVRIEDVDLNARPFPVAQGRSRNDAQLFDIDLTHGVGGAFPTPQVGENWWIKRSVGSRWVLDHRVDKNRGGRAAVDRAGVPDNVFLGFEVRETKTHLEYRGFVTFDEVTTDADGNPDEPEHYLVQWRPVTKQGNPIAFEKVKQVTWSARDKQLDAVDDPASDFFVQLPGTIERPKKWYYQARARAISSSMHKGGWSEWTTPVLPFRVALPQPPPPKNLNLRFKLREHRNHQLFRGIVAFDDVNYWDIPGFDYEDDVQKYIVQLQPLEVWDEAQLVTVTGFSKDTDQFTLTFSGQTTAAIVHGTNSTAEGVQTALAALSNLADDDVRVQRVQPVEHGERKYMVKFVGKYANTNEIQTIDNLSEELTGHFTLTFAGEETNPIRRDATSAEIYDELSSLNTIKDNNVRVEGGPLGSDTVTVTYVNDLGDQDVGVLTTGGDDPSDINVTIVQHGQNSIPLLTGTGTSCTVAVERKRSGLGQKWVTDETVGFPLPRPWDPIAYDNPDPTDPWYPAKHRFTRVEEAQNEIQSITNSGSTAGNFQIQWSGETTGNISRGATANQIKTALIALNGIGNSDVDVTGGPLGTDEALVEFKSALAHKNVKKLRLRNAGNSMGSDTVQVGDDGDPWPVRRRQVEDKDSEDNFIELGFLEIDIDGDDTFLTVTESGVDPNLPAIDDVTGELLSPFIIKLGVEQMLVYNRTIDPEDPTRYVYEVYRQYKDTKFREHSAGADITWLKDSYRYKVHYDGIPNPKRIWWRARARSVDRFNRKGPFSEWTEPTLPWTSADHRPPPPEHVRGDVMFDVHRHHPRYKMVVKFRDPAPDGFDIPGGDPEDDLDHYVANAQAIIRDDENGYIDGHDTHFYRVPDTLIGALVGVDGLSVSTEEMTVNLEPDLPPNIMDVINKTDGHRLYLRLSNPLIPGAPDEVVAAIELLNSSGSDRTWGITRGEKESVPRGHDPGEEVYLISTEMRRGHIKDKDEPGHNEHYAVDMGRVHLFHNKAGKIVDEDPEDLYYRVRAKSVDTYGRPSLWAPVKATQDISWTNPFKPAEDPDLLPPFPNYVALNFDEVHRGRWHKFRAVVEFAEVEYTAPDGDKKQDVTRYQVQLAASDADNLNANINNSVTSIVVNEVRKPPNAVPFFVLVDNEIIKVTTRTLLTGSQYTYVIQRATRGTTAASHLAAAKLFHFPFFHHSISAKNDNDPNNYNRVEFIHMHHFWTYKARVRTIDRYNRHSQWSPWTANGSPSDVTAPPDPTSVAVEVTEKAVHVTWDAPTEPGDPDTDAKVVLEDIAYFQVQLSKASNFSTILKFDRYVLGESKTWRIHKPSNSQFYARVRSVDGSGNKGNWVSNNQAKATIPAITIVEPVAFDKGGGRHARWRALPTVDESALSSYTDDDISHYVVRFCHKTANTTPITADKKDHRRVDADDPDLTVMFKNIPRNNYCFFQARAVDKDGKKGPWGGWTTGAKPSGGSAPSALTNVATVTAQRRVGIKWDVQLVDGAPDDTVAHVHVQVARNPSFTDMVDEAYVNPGKGTYRYAVPKRDQGVHHFVRVQPIDETGTPNNYQPGNTGIQVDAEPDPTSTTTTPGDGTINTLKQFSAGLRPIPIVSSLPPLPNADYPVGQMVLLTTDWKLYRNQNDTWSKAIDGADIASASIGSAQIGELVGDKIVAGTISAGRLATTLTFSQFMYLISGGSFLSGLSVPYVAITNSGKDRVQFVSSGGTASLIGTTGGNITFSGGEFMFGSSSLMVGRNSGAIHLANSAPGAPASGVHLYAAAGKLHWKGPDGTDHVVS